MARVNDYSNNPEAQGNLESWQQIINLYSLGQPDNTQNMAASPRPETGIPIQNQAAPQQENAFKAQQPMASPQASQAASPQPPQAAPGATQAEIRMSQPMHEPTNSDEDAGLAPWFGWIATVVIVAFLAWKFFKRSDG